MPIGHEDPDDDPDDKKHENQDQDPVEQREGLAASGAKRAGNEPEDVEEDGYEEKERKRDVDQVFGVMLEKQEED